MTHEEYQAKVRARRNTLLAEGDPGELERIKRIRQRQKEHRQRIKAGTVKKQIRIQPE